MSSLTPETVSRLQPVQRITRGWIANLVWSPDGRLLACGSAGGVALWRGSLDGQQVFIKGHNGPVKGIAFALNGATFATASADTQVKVWDLRAYSPSMQPVTAYTFPDAVEKITFTRTGTAIACAVDGTVRMLRPDGGMETLYAHDGEANTVALGGDGVLLASGGRDNTCRLYDLKLQKLQGVIGVHSDWVRAVAFHPSEPLLVTASRDHSARLWDVRDPQNPRQLVALRHVGDVRTAAFSADGAILATGSTDNRVQLWTVPAGDAITVLETHTKPVMTLAFHPRTPLLATGGGDNQIVVWGVGE
jgi:WD40 repeat protein